MNMDLLVVTAFGVGGATVAGAFIGFLFEKIPHKWNDAILGFAAGIMLAAAVLGLILPSVELTGKDGFWVTAAGILTGAVFLNMMDKVTPHLHHISGVDKEAHENNASLNKIMLFVMAIAIHNLPEGMAAGVGFGAGDISNAITVAIGIALHNIPEGMVIIASFTGFIEVVGTFIGYFAASISGAVLPFALAFAGGTMLYVISDEMIPETHSHGYETLATYAILVGFLVMLFMDTFIG